MRVEVVAGVGLDGSPPQIVHLAAYFRELFFELPAPMAEALHPRSSVSWNVRCE